MNVAEPRLAWVIRPPQLPESGTLRTRALERVISVSLVEQLPSFGGERSHLPKNEFDLVDGQRGTAIGRSMLHISRE